MTTFLVRGIVSALLADKRLSAEQNLKPLYQYGLLWSARSALNAISTLEPSSERNIVQQAYERAQCCLIEVMPHFTSLNTDPILTDLSQETIKEIRQRAAKLSTSLEEVMHTQFPGLHLIDQIASHVLSGAATSVTNLLSQTFSTPSIMDWAQGIGEKVGARAMEAGAHFVQERVAALTPPLKGLNILEPFKQIAPRNKVTLEMVDTKVNEFCTWSTAWVSMKCVNALFDFDDTDNPLRFPEHIENATSHGGVYKWVAKQVYRMVHFICRAPLKQLVSCIHRAFLAWQQKEPQARVLDLLHLIEEWLSSVSEGYSKVAHLPAEEWGGRRVLDLLDEQISAKLFGKIISLTQVCNRFISAAVDLFCIDWISCIDESCVPWPLKKMIQLTLFLPQLLWNALLKALGCFIVVRCIDLPGFLDASLKTPATQVPPSRFAAQMKEWGYKQVGNIVNHVDQRMHNKGEKISDLIQKDMHACLQVLLEVLHKSQYPTVEKLHNYIHQNQTLKEKFLKEMEEDALPIAMPVVALGLGSALEKALGSQELLDTVYDLLSICDETLTLVPLPHAPTDDIRALVDALLERIACYGLSDPLAQRIAVTQATGFANDITRAFGERPFLRSLLYKGLTTSLEIWKNTSQPQPT